MTGAEFLALAIDLSFLLVIAAIFLAFIRLALGPTLPDRVVALDMMTVLVVAFCGLFSLYTSESAFIDVAIIVALIGFLATVALARFAERRAGRDEAAAQQGRQP